MHKKEILYFTEAFQLVQEKCYLDAIHKFQDLVNDFPESDLADDALYNIGLSYYEMNQFQKSIEVLEEMIEKKKITREKVNDIVKRIRTCGAELITYMGTSAYYAPAAAVVQMIECYLRDKKKTIPCSAYLKGQYGIKGLYVGVPVVLGANGVEKIVEINLTKEEKKEFMKSVNSVAEVLNIAKKII